jgi:predicted glycoside hydrolase/deacetylase ChbG (UPF0249 family)
VPSPAAIRLVVNADGFGASAARNRGVLAAHRDGIVTSTSLLGNAADSAAVAATLKAVPTLGTGVLLALVGGRPVAPATSVPSLVGPDGALLPRMRDLLLVWAKAALRQDDVERELDAQVARWRDLGLPIDHLASQHGLGALPMIAAAMEKIARRHGIAGLRTAIEQPTLAWATDLSRGFLTAALGSLAWYSRRNMGTLRHGPQTWGHFESGRLDEIRLLEMLGRMGPGMHEILCTPDLDENAPSAPQGSELAALCSPRLRAALDRRTIELCRWSALF